MTEQGLRAARREAPGPGGTGVAEAAAGRATLGLTIEARAAGYTLRGGRRLLRPVSLSVRPGSLVAIVGPSGAGKTLLLDTLAGLTLPTEGAVLHDGSTCRPGDKATSVPIGYVPQDDILHRSLPLARTLRYAARLRMPAGTSAEQIELEVAEVLAALGMKELADTRVGLLSGGERKRASIAVELLARPSALFLDEPTSGLDPAMAADLVELLAGIAAGGTTVVFTSHNPADIAACSMVVVLAAHAYPAFAGPPSQALGHFRAESFDEIYLRLAAEPDPAVWAQRLPPGVPVAGPVPVPSGLRDRATAARRTPAPTGRGIPVGRGPGALRQWLLLTRRCADLTSRSPLTLAILLGSPVAIIAMFLFMFRSGAFAAADPSPSTAAMILFWIAFGGFFFGLTYGLAQICDEFPILRRERIVGVRITSYLASKLTVLLPVLAVVDALLLLTLSATGRLPDLGTSGWVRLLVTLLLTSVCSLALGLLASSAVSAPAQATMALPMLCFPQVLFVGAFLPVPVMALPGRVLSYLMSNRWAFDALGHTAGLVPLWRDGASPLGKPLAASYGDTFDSPASTDWLVLAGFTLVFLLAAGLVLAAKTPRRRRTSR